MNFIAEYDSDSEDDDKISTPRGKRTLVENKDTEESNTKKIRTGETNYNVSRLPPPTGIQSMFKDSEDSSLRDDPASHGGRLRTFAHERGNWASYVYIPVDDMFELSVADLTESLIRELKPVASFTRSESFHVSLSRTFVLRHHWINPLVQGLHTKMSRCKRTTLQFTDLEYYSNDEKTRTFLGLCVGGGVDTLLSYVEGIDSTLAEFRLPQYYQNPSFHISLAWAPGDIVGDLDKVQCEDFCRVLEEHEDTEVQMLDGVHVKELECKTGNKVYRIPLGS